MATGSVKWFDPQKGYGFIEPHAAGEQDVFLHKSAVSSAGISVLKEGQKISYDFVKNDVTGKNSAENIKLL